MGYRYQIHTKLTVNTGTKEYQKTINYYTYALDVFDYFTVTVNGKDFSEYESVTDDTVFIEAKGWVYMYAPNFFDILDTFGKNAKYEYSYADSNGNARHYINGNEILEDVVINKTGLDFDFDNDLLTVKGDFENHPEIADEISLLTEKIFPEDRLEKIKEQYSDTVELNIDWNNNLDALKAYIDAINKIAENENVYSVSYNSHWTDAEDMRLITVYSDGEKKLTYLENTL